MRRLCLGLAAAGTDRRGSGKQSRAEAAPAWRGGKSVHEDAFPNGWLPAPLCAA
jgi:hypothetical protein